MEPAIEAKAMGYAGMSCNAETVPTLPERMAQHSPTSGRRKHARQSLGKQVDVVRAGRLG